MDEEPLYPPQGAEHYEQSESSSSIRKDDHPSPRERSDRAFSSNHTDKMPCFQSILALVLALGLPKSDAEYAYDAWLASGFRDGAGRGICNWRAVLRNWKRLHYFPSQRIPPGLAEHQKTKPAILEEAKRDRHVKRADPLGTEEPGMSDKEFSQKLKSWMRDFR